ncbi:unnamed protein product [Heligmosomoides polygyrus]|uniref:CACTA en-spm transposon protein n=1 Tax=Heligmosomoides polygyrus TaxID=6339 RepID=A0A183GBC5_HELPZ|nr:unnamed protein product [Heligmosomoides polygyrus]
MPKRSRDISEFFDIEAYAVHSLRKEFSADVVSRYCSAKRTDGEHILRLEQVSRSLSEDSRPKRGIQWRRRMDREDRDWKKDHSLALERGVGCESSSRVDVFLKSSECENLPERTTLAFENLTQRWRLPLLRVTDWGTDACFQVPDACFQSVDLNNLMNPGFAQHAGGLMI